MLIKWFKNPFIADGVFDKEQKDLYFGHFGRMPTFLSFKKASKIILMNKHTTKMQIACPATALFLPQLPGS